MKKFTWSILLVIICLSGCRKSPEKLSYPQTRQDSTVDNYHGVQVADPYRWLEKDDSNETISWVKEQNKITSDFLSGFVGKEKIKERLTQLYDYPRFSAPDKKADRYFFWKNDGLQNQAVLYMQKKGVNNPAVVMNPNLLSEDGTVAITATSLSWDGKLLAYGISQSGSDQQEIKIRNVDTLDEYGETLFWCRFAEIAWHHNGEGFFYNRFPHPGTVADEDLTNYSKIYWHRLGTNQDGDELIYERADDKELGFAPVVTEDGNYLVLYVYHGTDSKNRVYYRPIDSDCDFIKLLDDADAEYIFIGNYDNIFYFRTDLDSPAKRIIAIDINKPEKKNWKTIIHEKTSRIIDIASVINNHFVIGYMYNVHHELEIYDLTGKFIRSLTLPTFGTLAGLNGSQFETEMFFGFTSFLFPTTIYRYDFETDEQSIFRRPSIDFDPTKFKTEQIFYSSKDGTMVPMYVTYKKGLKKKGTASAILYGYGGFDMSIRPFFNPSRLFWLEQGGVYAVVNLRGGGEFGSDWHEAGMLDKKQNVFDDFIYAARFLSEQKYTSPEKLAIEGSSNGGLLTAACMLQSPDSFGAVLCHVPVTDMLRYHKFTVGRYWVPEYGCAETDPNYFKFLYAYSPLHNVKVNAEYPPILITSADTDDRVVPLHSKKFTAQLQAKSSTDNIILLRVETKAGHGRGKPIAKQLEELADVYSFLFRIFKLTLR